MVSRTEVTLIDDIDGSKADETMKFGVDGTQYEIDLNSKHADQLRKFLAAYVLKACRTGRGPITPTRARASRAAAAATPTRADRAQNQAIREWAKSKGHDVSERGRIPANIVDQYHKEAGR